jgi:16S rRNA (guanine527-N7)-methyltransferase
MKPHFGNRSARIFPGSLSRSPMDAARIAALLEPFLEQSLSQSQLDQISMYIDLLLRWNGRINLTAIRNEEEIVTRHFGESLFLARHLFPAGVPQLIAHPAMGGTPPHPTQVLDIGSGAGFPALPLKIWAPNIHLTLIESNHKKAAFLSEIARALTLTNINVMTERAEALATRLSSTADIVTLRAVERLETVLPQAVTFLAPKGTLALLVTTAKIPHLMTLATLKWKPQINVPKSCKRVLSIGYKT